MPVAATLKCNRIEIVAAATQRSEDCCPWNSAKIAELSETVTGSMRRTRDSNIICEFIPILSVRMVNRSPRASQSDCFMLSPPIAVTSEANLSFR
jgi:hypothetical protein